MQPHINGLDASIQLTTKPLDAQEVENVVDQKLLDLQEARHVPRWLRTTL